MNLLRGFLREPEDWPRCHIFISAREGTFGATLLESLKREFPDRLNIRKLREMELSAPVERRRLRDFLRAHVSKIWDIDDDRVLDLVDGYPRVINRWHADDAEEARRTLDGLRRLVKESFKFRYSA